MMMIMITRVPYLESYRLVCLNLTCETSPSWGALPLLIYVERAAYMTSPIRIRITLLQVES